MPDMRDAIAQYLAFQGGQMPQGAPFSRGGQALPLQAYQQLPSGQYLPDMLSDTYSGMPPRPQDMPDDTIPPGGLPGMPPIPNTPPSPLGPGNTDPWQGPIPSPPVNTPMQAPMDPGVIPPGVPQAGPPAGQQIGGMDQAEWYRMYTGGR